MSSLSLDQLLAAARALPPAQRADFLDRNCGSKAHLRAQVELLLSAEAPAPNGANDIAPGSGDELGELSGQQIGRYKLLERIGEGGFGTVWMAEQKEPVRRKVALKILKLGMDTKQVVARFEQERQALALMDHPNIATVFDGGATSTGRPYFVMELVRGESIVAYCDERSLDTRARLTLFIDVCRAIQHAHQKGIIHRDIKPSNVLVTSHDGVPVPKVIDFGIAKATNAELTSMSLFTEHRQLVGTPSYMSPEQAEFSALDVDTRSDVYSLGVLLYELLTGSTPFDMKKLLERGLSEILRVIREVEPQRPSTRVSTQGKTATSVSVKRHADAQRLESVLRGDLDWIVMRCLEKDRTRRYDTVNGLALDLQRFLAGEVVSAAPPSAVYRLRKLLRRNRGAFAAASAVVLALVTGAVGFAWQAREASRQRDEAIAARKDEAAQRAIAETHATVAAANAARAEANAEEATSNAARAEANAKEAATNAEQAKAHARRAEAVNQFLVQMLGSADVRELGRDATIAQALDRASSTVGSAFATEPAIEAELRRVLGRTYLSIGRLERAGVHVEAAIDLDRRVSGEASAAYARSLGLGATLESERGNLRKALEVIDRAIEIAERANGADAAPAIGLRCDRGVFLMEARRDAEAIAVFRQELQGTTRRGELFTDEGLRQMNSLAVLLHRNGELDEAEELYREAAESGAKVLGERHPDVLISRANLGCMLAERGRHAEAEAALRAASGAMEEVFGAQHAKTGEALSVLGNLLKERGRFAEARPLLERALSTLLAARGPKGEFVATTKNRLAYTLSRVGELERAIAVQREANELYEEFEGLDGASTLIGRLALADMLVSADRTAEAEVIYEDVIAIGESTFGPEHRTVTKAKIGLGVLLMRLERWTDAETYVREATDAGRIADGIDDPNSIINQYNLSVVLRELGQMGPAEELARDTVERARRVIGDAHANLAYYLANWGRILGALGRHEDAMNMLLESISIAERAIGKPHATTASFTVDLVRILLDAGDTAAAEPHALAALEQYTEVRGANDRRTALARLELARCRTLTGRFAEAEPLLVESHAVIARERPAGHSELRRAERYCLDCYARWNAAEPSAERAANEAKWRAAVEASEAAGASGAKR